MSIEDQTSSKPEELTSKAKGIASHAAGGHGVVNRLHRAGFKSEFAYIGGFASIGFSLLSWIISRNKVGDDKAQADRWGIFIGHWAPTFMALGVALKLEEKN